MTTMLFPRLSSAADDGDKDLVRSAERVDDSEEDDSEEALVRPSKHVIHISVDGLRADAVTRQAESELPNFYRFRTEGTYTDNARTDVDYTNTLPNHTSQLTGRGVVGPNGHNWQKNTEPDEGETLHSNKGQYVASVFDVAHDNGLSTALYTSKSKFAIFDQSFNEVNGAKDVTGEDNGRDKIDRFVVEANTEALVKQFVRNMTESPKQYAFLHLRDPDHAGHVFDFDLGGDDAYMRSIRNIDRLLGDVFELVETSSALAQNTVIILTSDHGGGGSWHGHGHADRAANYTIPFYVWGRGVEQSEMYALNMTGRAHPQMARPAYDAEAAPIRNGDAANLSLAHLGLPPVPGSMINIAQDLSTGAMPNTGFHLADGTIRSDSTRAEADGS